MSTMYKDNLKSTHSMNNNILRVYDKYERDKSIGSYIMGETINALLWRCSFMFN